MLTALNGGAVTMWAPESSKNYRTKKKYKKKRTKPSEPTDNNQGVLFALLFPTLRRLFARVRSDLYAIMLACLLYLYPIKRLYAYMRATTCIAQNVVCTCTYMVHREASAYVVLFVVSKYRRKKMPAQRMRRYANACRCVQWTGW